MFDKLNVGRSAGTTELIGRALADPAVQGDPAEYRKQAKALSEIEPLVEQFREYKAVVARHRRRPRSSSRPATPTCASSRRRSCKSLERAARRAPARAQGPARPEGSERREERRPRDPRRHRRRRGGALRRRALPDVHALRRAPGLEARGDVDQRDRRRRHQGSHRVDRGARRLQPAEVRERRAPRAARAGDRGQRPHPHVHGDGGGAAGGRGSGHPDRREGPAHRHVLLERPRRPERQHDLLRRPASRTSRPASSSRSRTRSRRSRTARRR